MLIDENVYLDLHEVLTEDPIADFLDHHGVKGMRWGVRRQRRVAILARGGTKGSGKASWLRSTAHVGPIDFVRGRGIRGGAARKSKRQKTRNERVMAGEGRARDLIAFYGGSRVTDILPVRTKNVNKKTFTANDKLIVAGAGALFVAKLLAKSSKEAF